METVALVAPETLDDILVEQRPDGRYKLTMKDVALVLNLHDAGKSQQAIAEMFDVTQGRISKIINGFSDSREAAKRRLRAQAMRLTRHALKASARAASKGDAGPALELLDRLDVAPKRMPAASEKGSAKVMIMVGGQNPSALPIIDVGVLDGSQAGAPLSTSRPVECPDPIEVLPC